MQILNLNFKKSFATKIGSWLVLSLAYPLAVLAQATPYVPLAPIPGASETGVTLTSYLVGIYKVGIGLASVLAVLVIVWGGFTYISTDAIGSKNEGKEHISNALLGLVLAFSSYLIIYTISPNLVDLSLSLQPVGVTKNEDTYTANPELIAARSSAAADKVRALDAQAAAYREQADQAADAGNDDEAVRLAELANQKELESLKTFTKLTADINFDEAKKAAADIGANQQRLDRTNLMNNNFQVGIAALEARGDTAGAEQLKDQRFSYNQQIDYTRLLREANGGYLTEGELEEFSQKTLNERERLRVAGRPQDSNQIADVTLLMIQTLRAAKANR